MKRVWSSLLVACCMAMFGCAISGQFHPAMIKAPVAPPGGLLFTRFSAPLSLKFHSTPVTARVATSSTIFIREPFLGTSWAWGDASVQSAARNGGMNTIEYADYDFTEVLGLVMVTTVRVYGH